MRKVVVTEFVTLDGVVEAPEKWSFAYWNDEIAQFKHAELFGSDALLLGRVTYQGFAAAWPSRTDKTGFADRINSLPKYVVSTTMDKVEWNNSRLIKDNIATEVAKLKQQPGQDIFIHGSVTLAQTLLQADLIDQYNLLVYPIVLGQGLRLFKAGSQAKLKLVEAKPFSSGVVALTYQPVNAE
ncbi:MAG: dihydrofolate reductase family protein [Anaerolineae bacterium]